MSEHPQIEEAEKKRERERKKRGREKEREEGGREGSEHSQAKSSYSFFSLIGTSSTS